MEVIIPTSATGFGSIFRIFLLFLPAQTPEWVSNWPSLEHSSLLLSYLNHLATQQQQTSHCTIKQKMPIWSEFFITNFNNTTVTALTHENNVMATKLDVLVVNCNIFLSHYFIIVGLSVVWSKLFFGCTAWNRNHIPVHCQIHSFLYIQRIQNKETAFHQLPRKLQTEIIVACSTNQNKKHPIDCQIMAS
jgi:hypothetical protein